MRPTSSIMLQQNNNNNYPCLNGLDSTPEMLQKCSRTSLPFSRALELGLADLPLIRGLRAWALCSKNRRKAAGVLGGGQAPIASPAGLRSSSACPRPADVYLSREGGHMAYGLPFGPEAGQAGIRALVTVASLKTSEGSGKTQTQCLFLQTEKGSCLYSAGKPVFGSPIPASSVVGGWLKGKIGAAGCRETPVRQRDQVPTPVAESGGNHVGVRSGRRWRKSCNAARKKKKGGSRDGQQRWREDPAPENTLDERQEEQNNGGLEGKRFPSPQRIRRLGQEKLEVSQSPSCCHETSSSGRIHCGGDSPRGSASSSPSSGTQLPRKRDEDERIIYALDSTVSALRSVSDLESYKFHPESCSSSDITELIDAKSEEELDTQNDGCSEKEETESEEFLVVSSCGEDVLVCNPSLYRAELSLRNYSVVPKSLVPSERENGKEGLNKSEQAVAECQSRGEEELAGAVQDKTAAGTSEPLRLFEGHENSRLRDDSDVSIEAILETEGTVTAANCCNCSPSGSSGAGQQGEATWEKKEDDLQEGIIEQREIPEKGGEDGVRDYTVGDSKDNGLQKDSCKDVRENCALKDDWRLHVSAEQCRMNEETPETFAQTSRNQVGANSEISANVSHAAYTDLSTSLTHSRANPAHILPLSDSMATDRPLLEVEKEGEEEQVGLLLRGGSQEGESSHRRELEEPSEEEERGFAVAPQKGSKDEDEDEEDDFGVFMQAEGDSAWSEGLTMPASVPCESSKSVDLGNRAITDDPARWTAACKDSLVIQSDNSWTAFTQESSDQRQDAVGAWWPTSALEESRDKASTNHNVVAVFAEAFPSLPRASSSDPCDLDTVSTLAQMLRGKASHENGLLDSFQDLNKIICQRFTRANGASRELLLKTLQLEQQQAESQASAWTANRRLSPGPPTAHRHPHTAAARRRLSYDYNRNILV